MFSPIKSKLFMNELRVNQVFLTICLKHHPSVELAKKCRLDYMILRGLFQPE